MENCTECSRPAEWVRRTQFAGDHYYCDLHARKQGDFGEESSYKFWRNLSPERPKIKHPLSVEGFDGNLKDLCDKIHQMRYDQVMQFYAFAAAELKRQAEGDAEGGRSKLSSMLIGASDVAEEQRKRFEDIWKLCEPHMKD